MVNGQALIASWNKRDDPDYPYTGAGGQYGVRALKDIMDFTSGQGGVGEPVALSFANTNTVLKLGRFGGKVGNGGAPSCDDAFVADMVKSGKSLPSGNYSGPTSIGAGNNTYYVKGDVIITSDITDSTTSWASTAQIPKFRLVALGGNIYIQPGVRNLDGLYYAVPKTDGSKGQIVTCASGSSVMPDTQLSQQCAGTLTVNGALMAKQVLLLRTAGSIHDAGTPADVSAETIHYSPEMWIPTSSTAGIDDAYTSLPPVL
jgi:hypothetical protein